MNNKITTREKIIEQFKDGQTIAIGGQAKHGTPERLIQCLIDSGVKHLTLICLDAGAPNECIGKIIHKKIADKIITPYVGRNSECVNQYNEGTLKIELNPMGNLIERVRCGGMGLGGVLTKTGLGTIVEKNRQVIKLNGENYILEPALRADVALTRARKADPLGNLCYHGTGHNSNPIFVTAADISIVEADFIMDVNELPQDEIKTPANFVDMILEQRGV